MCPTHKPIKEEESPCNKTREVLEEAQKNLEDAEWSGAIGLLANPVRQFVASPVLGLVANVVPPVVAKANSHLPFLDDVSAAALGLSFQAVKMGYTILPHVPSVAEDAEEEVLDGVAHARKYAAEEGQRHQRGSSLATELVSLAKALTSYTINATLDLVTAPEHKIQAWERTTADFLGYLQQNGIGDEVKKMLLKPRLTADTIIMARIQKQLGHGIEGVALQQNPISNQETKDLSQLASRFIKYSIAAYGVYMMESSYVARQMVSSNAGSINEPERTSSTALKVEELIHLTMDDVVKAKIKRIAKYLNIDTDDIFYATPPGGGLELCGHFVAVDHQTKSVVLAIRGTHSTSEWVADFDAKSVPFCGGVAHKGMAQRAVYLWDSRDTRNAIARALQENPGYRFVVTGQSLGAGVANLYHIKCHFSGENPYQGKTSVCFSFGGPPVFATENDSSMAEAHVRCFSYIHGKDVVAHSSVDSVRRTTNVLSELDEITSKLSAVDRLMLLRGVKQPTEDMIRVVREGSKNLTPKPGAERLKLPGKFVVWFEEVSKEPRKFETYYCDPKAVSDKCIYFDINMMKEHLPLEYEFALETIATSNL